MRHVCIGSIRVVPPACHPGAAAYIRCLAWLLQACYLETGKNEFFLELILRTTAVKSERRLFSWSSKRKVKKRKGNTSDCALRCQICLL